MLAEPSRQAGIMCLGKREVRHVAMFAVPFFWCGVFVHFPLGTSKLGKTIQDMLHREVHVVVHSEKSSLPYIAALLLTCHLL